MTDTNKPKQFTLWKLMKAVTIAALITYAILPFIHRADSIFKSPVAFVTIMALLLLIQAPFLFFANFVDWIFGNRASKSGKENND